MSVELVLLVVTVRVMVTVCDILAFIYVLNKSKMEKERRYGYVMCARRKWNHLYVIAMRSPRLMSRNNKTVANAAI